MNPNSGTDSGSRDKAAQIRRRILRCLIERGRMMISDIAEQCGYSVPTVTKYINGLIEAGIVEAAGKKSLTRGKKPVVYMTRAEAKYFIGVDIHRHALMLCAMDLAGNVVGEASLQEMTYSNTPPLPGRNVRGCGPLHRKPRG